MKTTTEQRDVHLCYWVHNNVLFFTIGPGALTTGSAPLCNTTSEAVLKRIIDAYNPTSIEKV